ncbi:MAG TPA: LamG-like jellyroll fold domain-containing protein [Pantanalinema sp.]
MRHAWLLLPLALAACAPAVRPLAGPPAQAEAAQASSALWGRITSGYSAQATAAELTAYATVTLLDASNTVVATGLTDASGAFGLNPFVSWTPTTNAVYALDALKSFDKTNDRAALRFRTLVSWDGSKWRSLSGSTIAQGGGSGVLLNAQTTALAAIKDLRAVAGTTLLDALNPSTGVFTPAGGVTDAELVTVTGLVNQAIASNLDPVKWLTYTGGTYRLAMAPQTGRIIFDLEDALVQGPAGATAVRGVDGGRAYAIADEIALYDGQIGARGVANGLFGVTTGIAVSPEGIIYAGDRGNNRIQLLSLDGTFLRTLTTVGSGVGAFSNPHSVDLDRNGDLLVSDYVNYRVLKIDSAGNLRFGIGNGSSGWTASQSVTTGSGHNLLNSAHYAKFDPAGNIWIADTLNNRVLKYDSNGGFQMGIGNGTVWTTSAGNQSASSSVDRGFDSPISVGIAPNQDVYVADRKNNRVQRLSSGGAFLGKWGTTGSGPGQFNNPEDILVDQAGNVWVSEYAGHRIQKFTRTGTYLGQFGTNGSADGQFKTARGMAWGPDGALYVADENNYRFQRLIPANAPMQFVPGGNFNAAKGSISFWFKPNWGIDSATTRYFFEISQPNCRLVVTYGNPTTGIADQLYFYVSDNTASEAQTRRVGINKAELSQVLRKGKWHHVAATWDAANGQVRFFLQGREYGSFQTGNPASFAFGAPGTMMVGAAISGTTLQCNSVIDQFRIRDVVLSPEEIAREASGLVQE